MAKLLKLRRGTTSQHGSFTGAEGEVTVDTDKETLVVHNGSTAGGFPVARADGTGTTNFTITGELDAATLDISGNADIDGTLEADAITVNGTALSTVIAGTTVTNATNAAGLTGTPNITVGVVTGGSLDISGDADIDGTLEADAYTVNGTALDTHIAGVTVTNATNAVTATNANHVSVADNESTNENNLITFIENASATGNVGLESDGDFHYNPSTGLLTTPAISTSGNITIAGNLTVNGTTTTVATTNTTLTDNLLELNSGASSNANDAGILIERGSTGDNAIIAWDESADKFTVGTTTGTASSTGNISITTGTIVANVEGNVTGNVTGDVTGNADTATSLATARTIGGVSFNGTANINLPGVNTGGTQDTSGNADTATTLATARTIGGTSFNGSANITPAEATNADTVDNLHASNFLRSDANDSFSSGTLSITSTDDYPLTFNNSSNAKIDLKGATDPYIRFRENTTEKASLQWSSSGHFQILNQEDSSRLRIKDAIDFTADGTNYYNIIHAGNVGSSGSLSSVTVYTSAVHDSKGNVRSIPKLTKSSNHTLVASDAGQCVFVNAAATVTVNDGVFSIGDAVTIVNHHTADITIAQDTGMVLHNSADGSSGNRTLASRGMATIWFAANDTAYISGAGLS